MVLAQARQAELYSNSIHPALLLIYTTHRPNFSPVWAEGEAELTSRKRRDDASQLLSGQSENF
jgi:hypothetical protein